jgi:type IV pilus assembly protein PilB
LRALLRQDPDVILLGEIRDGETATVAFKAALTGHMVLSTLHTNDAPSTIMRLKDMGIDTFMLNAAVQVVVAQRLGKKVCQECKAPDERATPELLKQYGFPASAIGKFQPMIGKGCNRCNGSGFKGRVPLHEVMVMSEGIKALVGSSASTEDIRKLAIQEGMKTQKMNAMRKIVAGLMSIDALRELGE